MRKIVGFLKDAAGITVAVCFALYLVAALGADFTSALAFPHFLSLFAFSCMITAANYITKIKKISPIWSRLIHFAVLLISFVFLFLLTGNIRFSAAKIFAAVIIFTILYAVAFAISLLLRHLFNKKQVATEKAKATEEYKPRFH